MKGVLTVLVGLPASGKSTWAKENGGKASIVSTDEIRAELTGDAGDQSRNADVWEIAFSRAEALLRAGKNVIFDATNCGRANRRLLLKGLKSQARDVIAVYFNTSLDECKRRNALRDRVVPEEVLNRMSAR